MNEKIHHWYQEYGLDFEKSFYIKYSEILTKIYFEFNLENSNKFGLYLFLRNSDLYRFLIRGEAMVETLEPEYEEC